MEAFTARVDRALATFYDELLPRYIDRYYRKPGYELVARMMDAHDSGQLDPGGPAPTAGARKRSEHLADACPVEIVPSAVESGGGIVLGMFRRNAAHHVYSDVDYNTLYDERHIELYEGSFVAAVSEDRLDEEILLTIFHEHIHFLESFFLPAEQPLAGRERGLAHTRYSVDEARRRDRRHLLWRLAGWGVLAVMAVLAVVSALFVARGSEPIVEDDGPADESARTPYVPRYQTEEEVEAATTELLMQITMAVTSAETVEGIRAGVDFPLVADTTDPYGHGVLSWGRLVPVEGALTDLPDTNDRAVLCWAKPSLELVDVTLICAIFLDEGYVLTPAGIERR